jgi:hypothetical protein
LTHHFILAVVAVVAVAAVAAVVAVAVVAVVAVLRLDPNRVTAVEGLFLARMDAWVRVWSIPYQRVGTPYPVNLPLAFVRPRTWRNGRSNRQQASA